MEEIYIIKLKGLPTSSQESLRDNKASFYYRKDLTGEALLGFGILHSFVGLILIVLTIINLILLNVFSMKLVSPGILCGAIFAIAGLMGVITAHKRKTDISKSKIQVKIFFILSIITLLLTTTFLILTLFDLKEKSVNKYIAWNTLLSFIFEWFTSLLSIFTCMRVIWPGSLGFCAKDWPMHQKLKRKIIVSTQIYTNGVKQDEDVIRNLGPNCVISLSPPQNDAITRSDNYSDTNECNSICEFCEQNKPKCEHNLRTNCLNDEFDEQYDSEFDVENFDSIEDTNVCESTHKEQEIDSNYENNRNDCTQESENKYETIDGNKTFDQNNCSNKSESFNNCEELENQNKNSTNSSEDNDSPKQCCDKSKECLTEV